MMTCYNILECFKKIHSIIFIEKNKKNIKNISELKIFCVHGYLHLYMYLSYICICTYTLKSSNKMHECHLYHRHHLQLAYMSSALSTTCKGGKYGKVDQESAPLNVNLELPLESDFY